MYKKLFANFIFGCVIVRRLSKCEVKVRKPIQTTILKSLYSLVGFLQFLKLNCCQIFVYLQIIYIEPFNIQFILSGRLAVVCDDYFVPSMERICEEMSLPSDVGNVLILHYEL